MNFLSRMTAANLSVAVWRWRWTALSLLVAIIVGGFFLVRQEMRQDLQRRLMAASPFEVAAHPDLVRFAAEEAKPLYAAHCASCHGDAMQGYPGIGAPSLKDAAWIYGDGSIYQIERSILFGIRDANQRTRDVTEMPAYGQRGVLNENQIQDVVEYLLKLNHRPYDVEAANQGSKVFYQSDAACFDCHGDDARGDKFDGAPDLMSGIWNWGSSRQDLYNSIYFGRHGIMPGWLGPLTLEQIRAMAVYIHSLSSAAANAKPAQAGPS